VGGVIQLQKTSNVEILEGVQKVTNPNPKRGSGSRDVRGGGVDTEVGVGQAHGA